VSSSDYLRMRCDDARTALSARLDGEDPPFGPAETQTHVNGCPACQDWLARAERVTRAVRIQPVDVPDLTARILTSVRADGSLARPGPVGAKVRTSLRWGLGALAVVQLAIAVPELLGASGHAAHTGREVAAFDIALAVGLLLVASYPVYARAFSPVVVTLVVCLASASTVDMLQGLVAPTHVAIHLIAVIQAGLVWLLARSSGPTPAPA
jgi:predicted anti-sigma-YlaC factor YlaD